MGGVGVTGTLGMFTRGEDFAAPFGFGAIETAADVAVAPNFKVVATKPFDGLGDACAAVFRVAYGFTVDGATRTAVEVGVAKICTSAWGRCGFADVVAVGVTLGTLHDGRPQLDAGLADSFAVAVAVEVTRAEDLLKLGAINVEVTLDGEDEAVVGVGSTSRVPFEAKAGNE